jgi:hypothetical protein
LNSQEAKARSQRGEESQQAEELGIGSGFASSFFAASLASSLLGCSNLLTAEAGTGLNSQGAKARSQRRQEFQRAEEWGIGPVRLFILCGFLGVFAAWLFQFV